MTIDVNNNTTATQKSPSNDKFVTFGAVCATFGRLAEGVNTRALDARLRIRQSGSATWHSVLMGGLRGVVGAHSVHLSDGLVVLADARIDNVEEVWPLCGGPAAPRSSADVAAAAYVRWGADCFDRLEGDYGVVIIDQRRAEIIAARDPFGVRALAYGLDKGTFAVASTVGAVEASLGPCHLNREYLARYLAGTHRLNHELSALAEVSWLPAGHRLVWRPGTLAVTRWFSLSPRMHAKTEAEAAEEFGHLFTRAVAARLPAAGQAGILLSGGLDSSSVACQSADLCSATRARVTVHTFSAVYTEIPEADERVYVEAVTAQYPSLRSHVYPWDGVGWSLKKLGPEDGFPMDEPPLTSRTELSELALFAREAGVGVLLSGLWADQVLTRDPYSLPAVFWSLPFTRQRSELAYFLKHPNRVPWVNAIRLLSHGARPMKWNRGRSPFDSIIRNSLAWSARIRDYFDRQARFTGTEMRYPFLDRFLVEFLMGLPAEWSFRANDRKLIVRRGIAAGLPDRIRHRRTYSHPTRAHSDGIKRDHKAIRDLLSQPRVLDIGLADRPHIERVLGWFQQPVTPFPNDLHRLLAVEVWLRHRSQLGYPL